jgi:uncharacterized iron-regulated membrane protein
MKLPLFVRKLHKWLGLIVGIQILFWVVGGLVMSAFPIERVHGDHTRTPREPVAINMASILPLDELLKRHPVEVTRVILTDGFDGPQYRLTDTENQLTVINALNGEPVTALTGRQAEAVALSNYSGPGKAINTQRIEKADTEYRGPVPVWRVEFDDWESTTLYIAENSGQVMASRNTMWRIFDFVWMLHIMDYREREDFNHPLLIIAALLAVTLACSGIYMLTRTLSPRDFRFFGK